jgi:hypothetical protein
MKVNPTELAKWKANEESRNKIKEEERDRIIEIIKNHDFWFVTDRDELIEKINQ